MTRVSPGQFPFVPSRGFLGVWLPRATPFRACPLKPAQHG